MCRLNFFIPWRPGMKYVLYDIMRKHLLGLRQIVDFRRTSFKAEDSIINTHFHFEGTCSDGGSHVRYCIRLVPGMVKMPRQTTRTFKSTEFIKLNKQHYARGKCVFSFITNILNYLQPIFFLRWDRIYHLIDSFHWAFSVNVSRGYENKINVFSRFHDISTSSE